GYEDHLAGDDACAAGHAHLFYRAICQGFLLHRETIEAIALIGSLAEAFTARARALIRRRTNLDRTARRLCPGLAVGLSGFRSPARDSCCVLLFPVAVLGVRNSVLFGFSKHVWH